MCLGKCWKPDPGSMWYCHLGLRTKTHSWAVHHKTQHKGSGAGFLGPQSPQKEPSPPSTESCECPVVGRAWPGRTERMCLYFSKERAVGRQDGAWWAAGQGKDGVVRRKNPRATSGILWCSLPQALSSLSSQPCPHFLLTPSLIVILLTGVQRSPGWLWDSVCFVHWIPAGGAVRLVSVRQTSCGVMCSGPGGSSRSLPAFIPIGKEEGRTAYWANLTQNQWMRKPLNEETNDWGNIGLKPLSWHIVCVVFILPRLTHLPPRCPASRTSNSASPSQVPHKDPHTVFASSLLWLSSKLRGLLWPQLWGRLLPEPPQALQVPPTPAPELWLLWQWQWSAVWGLPQWPEPWGLLLTWIMRLAKTFESSKMSGTDPSLCILFLSPLSVSEIFLEGFQVLPWRVDPTALQELSASPHLLYVPVKK